VNALLIQRNSTAILRNQSHQNGPVSQIAIGLFSGNSLVSFAALVAQVETARDSRRRVAAVVTSNHDSFSTF
jgi:hypothetical protein